MGPIVELDSTLPLWPMGAAFRALMGLLRLLFAVRGSQFQSFFWGKLRLRFWQILSGEVMLLSFKQTLAEARVRKIVTMNEQHYPSNILVAAANASGIETNQILHGGLASPVYVPFWSRYCWPEYEQTAKALHQFGALRSRIKVVPGLQVAAQVRGRNGASSRRLEQSPQKTKVLFLAQYHGYSFYGIGCFRHALAMMISVAAEKQLELELNIRPHPRDSTNDIESMAGLLHEANLVPRFSTPGDTLAHEASACDIVVSTASTGIFTAIALGTPACLIWGDDQQEAHGMPPLSDEWVVRDREGLLGRMDSVLQASAEERIRFAQEQALALGLGNLQSAALRFARELFSEPT